MPRVTSNAGNSMSAVPDRHFGSVFKKVHAVVADVRSQKERTPMRVPHWLKYPSSLRPRAHRHNPHTNGDETSPFSALPAELVVHIPQFLPPNDIALMQMVSRAFCDIVKGSSALQFIIEAFLADVVEGPAVSSLSTSRARLDQLMNWNRARRGRHWENVWEHDLSDDRLALGRIHGQTFSTFNSESSTLQLITIPSRLAGTSLKINSITFPIPITDHWFDSSQGLVIVRTHTSQGVPVLAFLHESTGGLFPGINAAHVPLCQSTDEEAVMSEAEVNLRVWGNLNLICRNIKSLRQDITIRDWRCDETFVTIRNGGGEHQFPTDVTFLDANHLVCALVPHDSVTASIVVIPWRTLPCKIIGIAEALVHSVVFQLPGPSIGNKYTNTLLNSRSWLSCEPNISWNDRAPSTVPFFDAGNHPPLVTLDITVASNALGNFDEWGYVHADREKLCFVIPGRTLMSRVAGLDAADGWSVRSIPWSDWGEDTRVWPQNGQERGDVRAYGSRLLCIENSNDYTGKVVIYDFDSPESMIRDIRSGDKARLDEIVVEPLHLPKSHHHYLREPVITRAPYRRLETNVQVYIYEPAAFIENCFMLLSPEQVTCFSIYDA